MMPAFAAVFLAVFNRLFSFLVTYLGFRFALKLTILTGLAAMYVSGLLGFKAFVEPLVTALFSTAFGAVLGLAFPPISGTVLAGLVSLWVGGMMYSYFERLGMALVK